ncbi:MAG: hypothetical protein Q4B01_09190 [Eubacteriales bacterium]|nr:hypothetical protein [Eubacteriales bacterium]
MNKTLHSLHGRQKLQYLWDYYKLPLAGLLIILLISGSLIYHKVTHKDTDLYLALVNVSMSESMQQKMTGDFLTDVNLSPAKHRLELYQGLYLTDDSASEYHEYTYASRMKILTTINSQLLDVVFMNQEAFDAFSQNGYLEDLPKLLQNDPELLDRITPNLVRGTIILEDNAIDLLFDETATYEAVTEDSICGLDLSTSPFFKDSGFTEPVYLGIIRNSLRKELASSYLAYLFP